MARRPKWKAVLLAVPTTLLIFGGTWMLLFAFLGDRLAHAMGFNALIGVLVGFALGYALHRWVIIPVLVSRFKQRTSTIP